MDMYTALADPNRRRIIELIATSGQLSSTEIADKFEVSAPAISQHLKVLRETRLVQVEKKAQQRIYRINPEPMLEMESWIQQMTRHWEKRFDALETLLLEEKKKKIQGKGVSKK